MANPTSNFNWQMPTNTDLVKDLPADFEVFGQAVDTSLADLKGGTTGQILSKNSNSDMDFVWIANDQGDITGITASSPLTGGGSSGAITVGIQSASTTQSGAVQLTDSTSSTSTSTAATPNSVKSAYDLANGAIPKSLVDAAGDILYATANDTVARLAIGTAGQVLKVNSGATAPEWGAAGGGGAVELVKARTTFSNVADTSTTFDGVFTSTYRNYLIVLDNVYGATTDADLRMIMKYSTSTDQGADYYWADVKAKFDATASTVQGNAVGYYLIADLIGGSSYPGGGTVNLNAGVASEPCQIQSHYSTSYYGSTESAGGASTVARTYTGFKLTASSGNITGAVTIYGLKVS